MYRRPTAAAASAPSDHPAELIPGSRIPMATAVHQEMSARILVFDSDPIACASLGSWLNRRGHSVALACTHDMAATLLQRIRFDLAICDETPCTPESKHWVEKLLQQPPCPMILISSTPTLEVAIRAANLPLSGYLAKPVNRPALAEILERTLGKPGH